MHSTGFRIILLQGKIFYGHLSTAGTVAKLIPNAETTFQQQPLKGSRGRGLIMNFSIITQVIIEIPALSLAENGVIFNK